MTALQTRQATRAKNLRTGLTLLSIAIVFGLGFIANRLLFS